MPSSKAKISTTLPVELREIEKKYALAGSLSAEFTQVNESAVMGTKKTSSGTLLVKKPGRIRWETLQPDKSLLASDGKTFWFYTPPFDEDERGQLIVRKSAAVQSKFANALLSASFSNTPGLKVTQRGPGLYLLKPKAGTAGTLVQATVYVDREKKLIEKVSLEHADGNTAVITLNGIELGKPLDPSLFEFKAPPNTDVIQQ